MQTRNGADNLNFSELIDEIKGLLLGSWRFRWQAISLTWIFCVASWLIIFAMPDIYKASTRLYIDTKDSLRPLLQGLAINPDLLDEVLVTVKSITSRPNLGRIAAEIDPECEDARRLIEFAERGIAAGTSESIGAHPVSVLEPPTRSRKKTRESSVPGLIARSTIPEES